MNRSLIRYAPPRASNYDRVELRSAPFVVADGERACYSGSPDLPALAEYLEHRRARSRRIAAVRRRMLRRHREAFGS
jgi:hypothetical protein